MSDEAPSHRIGNVGENAVVQQGENLYNYNISLQVHDAKDAETLLRLLREKGERLYYGPLLRRLDPVVLVNRRDQIAEIANFFDDASASVLYVLGLAAIGKSTLVRGALEFRQADTPAVWVTGAGLDTDRLLTDVNAGLQLNAQTVVNDSRAQLTEKIAAVLGAVMRPSILVLDGFEAVLDADGGYLSERMAQTMEALVTLEHQVKVLVTTRRLPQGVGEGSPGIQLLRLGGLSDEMAGEFLRERAHIDPQELDGMLSAEAMKKLRGHPKFIELFASAIAETPAEQVVAGLLKATDIGEFIEDQVLMHLGAEEIEVLRAAAVFREGFTFEALNAVYGGDALTQSVRTLVRRAVLEVSSGPQKAYYLHPLLREAVPREPEQEASAHDAAARWFFREPFTPAELKTWDDGLYHLRLAAEIGRNEKYFGPYRDFLFEFNRPLGYAGWGRRLVKEEKALETLAKDPSDKLTIRWMLGNELKKLNEYGEAETVFRDLIKVLTDEQEQLSDEERNENTQWLLMIKQKLGSTLLTQDKIEEAQQLANEIEPVAEASQKLQYKVRYRELRFEIARKGENPPEMLQCAKDYLAAAEQWFEQDPSPQTHDALAEAHFGMGVSYLLLTKYPEMFHHLSEQLRIKLEIGKITGVAAGLYNLGVIVSKQDQVVSGAMLMTSEQINLEIDVLPNADTIESRFMIIQKFLEDDQNIEIGRKAIAAISEKLLPYYERALARRRG